MAENSALLLLQLLMEEIQCECDASNWLDVEI